MSDAKNPPKGGGRVNTRINPPLSDDLATTPIRHYMTRNPIYATPSTTVRRAIDMMLKHSISGLPVLDDTQVCLGLYTELDAMLQGASQSIDSPIRYSKPAVLVLPDTPYRDVLILMVKKRIKRIPIVDERKRLMGIISRRDLIRALHGDNKK